jgi:hypothetical protein
LRVVDDFQLTTIIAKAVSTCVLESRGETLTISSEQATCMAKVVITALAQAGLAIEPIKKGKDLG